MIGQVVIADAGPLIAFARIERLYLLQDLFSEVMLTDLVSQEVLSDGRFKDSLLIEKAIQAGWLKVQDSPENLQAPAGIAGFLIGLDPGEKGSILWANQLRAAGKYPLMIIDEAKGRAAARRLELDVMGVVGIIAVARQVELIEQAAPLLRALQTSGYYLSQTVIDVALSIAGEH